jgi:precorrin-6x reductase
MRLALLVGVGDARRIFRWPCDFVIAARSGKDGGPRSTMLARLEAETTLRSIRRPRMRLG